MIPPPTSDRPHGSQLVELASGIDALYLSGRAAIRASYISYLTDLRARAEDTDNGLPCFLGGEEFRIAPHAFGKYRFCLIHTFGRVGLTASEKLPAIRIQPKAEFLHGAGAAGMVNFFRNILEQEFGPTLLTVSRIDLHSDWQGWALGGDDRHRIALGDALSLLDHFARAAPKISMASLAPKLTASQLTASLGGVPTRTERNPDDSSALMSCCE